MTLRIVDWETRFENNRTRELKKLDWVPVPNRMDGAGYLELLDHRDGAAHFGVWIALLEIASRCQPRGLLVQSSGHPHTVQTVARMAHMSVTHVTHATERLLSLHWLEEVPTENTGDIEKISHPAAEECLRARARVSVPFSSVVNTSTEIKSYTRAREPAPRIAVASGFAQFWERWCTLTGRRQRQEASCRAWISVAASAKLDAVMACLERYGESDEVQRGVVSNPDRWIYEQARDGFAGGWQPKQNGSRIAGEMERYLDEH